MMKRAARAMAEQGKEIRLKDKAEEEGKADAG